MEKLLQPGKLVIGICYYGDEGYRDYYANITINKETVIWEDLEKEQTYIFHRPEYEQTIENLRKRCIRYTKRYKHKRHAY